MLARGDGIITVKTIGGGSLNVQNFPCEVSKGGGKGAGGGSIRDKTQTRRKEGGDSKRSRWPMWKVKEKGSGSRGRENINNSSLTVMPEGPEQANTWKQGVLGVEEGGCYRWTGPSTSYNKLAKIVKWKFLIDKAEKINTQRT